MNKRQRNRCFLVAFRRTWTLKHYILSAQRRVSGSWPGTSVISIQELLITLTLSPTSVVSEILAWSIHFPRTCTRIYNADSGMYNIDIRRQSFQRRSPAVPVSGSPEV